MLLVFYTLYIVFHSYNYLNENSISNIKTEIFILSDESVITKKIILPYAIASIDGIYPETLEKGVDIIKVNIFANVTYTNGATNNILLVDSFINDELYPNSNYSYIDTNLVGRYFVDVNIGGSFYEGIIEVVDASTSSTNVKSISIEDDTNIIHSFTNDSLNEILFNTVLSNPVTVTFNDDSTIEFYPTLKMLSHDAPLSIYGNITTEGTYKVTLTMPSSDFKIDYALNVYEKQEDAVKELEVDVDFEDGILTYIFLNNDMVEVYYSLTENKSLLFGYYSYTISGNTIAVLCDDIPAMFNNDNGTLTIID